MPKNQSRGRSRRLQKKTDGEKRTTVSKSETYEISRMKDKGRKKEKISESGHGGDRRPHSSSSREVAKNRPYTDNEKQLIFCMKNPNDEKKLGKVRAMENITTHKEKHREDITTHKEKHRPLCSENKNMRTNYKRESLKLKCNKQIAQPPSAMKEDASTKSKQELLDNLNGLIKKHQDLTRMIDDFKEENERKFWSPEDNESPVVTPEPSVFNCLTVDPENNVELVIRSVVAKYCFGSDDEDNEGGILQNEKEKINEMPDEEMIEYKTVGHFSLNDQHDKESSHKSADRNSMSKSSHKSADRNNMSKSSHKSADRNSMSKSNHKSAYRNSMSKGELIENKNHFSTDSQLQHKQDTSCDEFIGRQKTRNKIYFSDAELKVTNTNRIRVTKSAGNINSRDNVPAVVVRPVESDDSIYHTTRDFKKQTNTESSKNRLPHNTIIPPDILNGNNTQQISCISNVGRVHEQHAKLETVNFLSVPHPPGISKADKQPSFSNQVDKLPNVYIPHPPELKKMIKLPVAREWLLPNKFQKEKLQNGSIEANQHRAHGYVRLPSVHNRGASPKSANTSLQSKIEREGKMSHLQREISKDDRLPNVTLTSGKLENVKTSFTNNPVHRSKKDKSPDVRENNKSFEVPHRRSTYNSIKLPNVLQSPDAVRERETTYTPRPPNEPLTDSAHIPHPPKYRNEDAKPQRRRLLKNCNNILPLHSSKNFTNNACGTLSVDQAIKRILL